MVMVLIAGVGERFFSHGGLVSPGVLTLLNVSLLLGFALFALVPALIYGQRTRAINQQLAEAREAQLALKAEHLAQTQAALERADRHGRDPEGHREFAVGRAAGARRHRAQCATAWSGGFSATAWHASATAALHLAAFTATDEAGAAGAARSLAPLPVATTYLAAPAPHRPASDRHRQR